MKTEKYLNIVLLETISFQNLVSKINKAFEVNFTSINKKGRYIAEGYTKDYKIEVIDKVDELGDFLSDDNYTLSFSFPQSDKCKYDEMEIVIKNKLSLFDINWEYGVWSRDTNDDEITKIFPKF